MKYITRKGKKFYRCGIQETKYRAEKLIKKLKVDFPDRIFIKQKEHIYGKDRFVIYYSEVKKPA